MSTHKHIDKICCAALAIILILTILFMNGNALGIQSVSAAPAYESKLFDTSKVHTIDIIMNDWDSFIETCTNEEYAPCSVIINGEAFKNVAIRAKGNTSLSSVRSYGNNRYSFKIEFDGYETGKTYYGLDKLCLNNVIQDNTYMKDYIVYRMMNEFGAAAPLVSFIKVSVNGEYFGLYLAVEAVEDSFIRRNYGTSGGNLYKPDSMNMGGGRGNGKDFDPGQFTQKNEETVQPEKRAQRFSISSNNAVDTNENAPQKENRSRGGFNRGGGMPGGNRGGFGGGGMPGGFGGFGGNDVSLVYSDDEFSSYENIFSSAKNDITDSDKERLIASLKSLNEKTDIENVVDIEAVIRYFVVHNFSVNFDSYTGSMIHNYYLYEDEGTLSMLPWDYNLAFGGFQSSSDATSLVNYPIDSPVSGGTVESRPMIAWIFSDEEYTNLYHKLFSEFITSYFDSGKFEAEINNAYNLIASYVESDPSKFCTYEEFEKGVSTLREFCLLRAESIRGQLDGRIPSTSDGQNTDSSALVNADTISIPAMGSMGFGGGPGGNRGGMPAMGENRGSRVQKMNVNTTDATTSSEPDESATPERQRPEFGGERPNFGSMPPEFNGEAPDFGGTPPEGGQFPRNENAQSPDMNFENMQPPNRDFGNMQPPNMNFRGGMQTSSQTNSFFSDNVFLLALSFLVLGAGLSVAFIFKR